MQWNGQFAAGQTDREPVMGFDCHAAAPATAGVAVPPQKPLDGVNLLPFVAVRQSGRLHGQLLWRAGQQHAARVGDWKLAGTRTSPPMLFNLRADLGEQHGVAASHPDKLNELQTAFAEWEQGTLPAKWVRQDQQNAAPGGKLKTGDDAPRPRRAPNAARIDEAFQSADKYNDGKQSQDEYPQNVLFDGVNANRDGFATLEEVRADCPQRRAQPGGNAMP